MTSPNPVPLIPSFGGDDGAGPRKLAIICSKGNLDMAYPGLILGTAALGNGIETHLFFTFWGFDMITKTRMARLKFSPVGNTAMHLPMGGVRLPQALAPIPGVQAFATKMMRKQIRDLDVPEVPEMVQQIADMGGHLWGCRMSADMMGLTLDDLFDGVEDIINADAFIEKSNGAQLLFI